MQLVRFPALASRSGHRTCHELTPPSVLPTGPGNRVHKAQRREAGRALVSDNFNLDQAADAFDTLAVTQQLRTHNLAGQVIIVR
ncbi:hypothetical protein C6382_06725 [Pseudomonas sp. BBP2017]|nr:hypothetical protein C6382_06725 [Pseudomonas sp. BBP2017]